MNERIPTQINKPTGVTEELANKWTNWADSKFPKATQLSRAKHLRKEVNELIKCIEDGRHNDLGGELSDCYALLGHIAWHGDLNVNDEMIEKLGIVEEREWGEADSDGIYEHVKKPRECPNPKCDQFPVRGIAPHHYQRDLLGVVITIFGPRNEWPNNFVGHDTEGTYFCPVCKKGMDEFLHDH